MDLEINEAYLPYFQAENRFAVLLGSGNSGKSVAVAQKHVVRACAAKERFLIMRKVQNTLNDSVVMNITGILDQLQIKYKQNHTANTITLPNGSVFMFRGLDNPEKIKSIYGITSVWLEEATEFEKDEVQQINERLRETVTYSQITLSFNPISEDHWIREYFWTNPPRDTYQLKTTYVDNKWVKPEKIAEIEEMKTRDPHHYRVYALGEWGTTLKGNEFYRNFSYGVNVRGDLAYDPLLPLHISFDFNVAPYMTAVISQIVGKEVRIIDEVCLSYPRNNTEDTCLEILNRYPNHDAGLLVYGDPSGGATSTLVKGGGTNYTIIQRVMAPWKPVMRVLPKHPGVLMRCQWINSVLPNQGDVKFYVSSNCLKTSNDLFSVKMDSDGKKLKQTGKDPITGRSVEVVGHCSDAVDYLLCAAFPDEFRLYQRGGKVTGRYTNALDRRSYSI